jgi:hypothetical protein
MVTDSVELLWNFPQNYEYNKQWSQILWNFYGTSHKTTINNGHRFCGNFMELPTKLQ